MLANVALLVAATAASPASPVEIRFCPERVVRAYPLDSLRGLLHFHVCDGPDGINCAGIPPRFNNIVLPLADGDRPIQSGDVVTVAN